MCFTGFEPCCLRSPAECALAHGRRMPSVPGVLAGLLPNRTQVIHLLPGELPHSAHCWFPELRVCVPCLPGIKGRVFHCLDRRPLPRPPHFRPNYYHRTSQYPSPPPPPPTCPTQRLAEPSRSGARQPITSRSRGRSACWRATRPPRGQCMPTLGIITQDMFRIPSSPLGYRLRLFSVTLISLIWETMSCCCPARTSLPHQSLILLHCSTMYPRRSSPSTAAVVCIGRRLVSTLALLVPCRQRLQGAPSLQYTCTTV